MKKSILIEALKSDIVHIRNEATVKVNLFFNPIETIDERGNET
jgi:hypothetical protein